MPGKSSPSSFAPDRMGRAHLARFDQGLDYRQLAMRGAFFHEHKLTYWVIFGK
jgi:hypothetical protein